MYYSLPSIICSPIFYRSHLTAMVFHLQKFSFRYILCLISPSFSHHPHYLPTFSPVPKGI